MTSVDKGVGVSVAALSAVSVSVLVAASAAVDVRVVVDISAVVAVGVASSGAGVAGGIEPGATTLISTLPEHPGAVPGCSGAQRTR